MKLFVYCLKKVNSYICYTNKYQCWPVKHLSSNASDLANLTLKTVCVIKKKSSSLFLSQKMSVN